MARWRRRQCIMNTITDLQAHFLRAYGALEDEEVERSKPQTKNNMLVTAVSSNPRSLQCRWGFDNSRACDSFHLGEMIRFFSMRSKTIFLGSTLIDSGYDNAFDEEEQEDEEQGGWDDQKGYKDGRNVSYNEGNRAANIASSDILSITASLRQVPDYQLDPNHTGCGIRRRLLPLLDCIDGFIGHRRAVIGVTDVMVWKWSTAHASQRKRNTDSWKSPSRSSAEVDIRGAKLVGIRKITPRPSAIDIMNHSVSIVEKAGKVVAPSTSSPSTLPLNVLQQSQEEARLFFTALKRNWES
ncbi:hypothetical protein UA08_01027 [Talaromyces atroroseus]|uniref:Uncharacterized protein n=1 Tax=Talaromyces atroroseus TaxID=1441469 RepID=A0A225BA14_TALAT|nr:hypothetical protein UA08_01027 [Talaromyces atroroseus]OKL64226.1 hypothetical protein UA08_01027 [Talaromyces atroroseus]